MMIITFQASNEMEAYTSTLGLFHRYLIRTSTPCTQTVQKNSFNKKDFLGMLNIFYILSEQS